MSENESSASRGMGVFLHILFLSLVRTLHAGACDATAGLQQCLPGSDRHGVSSALLQRETKSAWKTSSRANVLAPPASVPTEGEGIPREKHPLMKPAEAAHGTHDVKSSSVVLAWTLIGSVCVVAASLHLAFWPDKAVQRSTFKVIHEALLIFCAVLFFDGFHKTTSTLLHEPAEPTTDDHHNLPPEFRSIVIDFVRVLFVWAAFEGGLRWTRKRSWWIEPFGLMGSHILGFTLIQFFGDLQQRGPWSNKPLNSLMLTVFAALMIWCLYIISAHMRASLEDGKCSHWQHLCGEFEDEAAGLAVGLLLTQTIKFSITGYMPSLHGSPKDKTQRQLTLLYLTALLFTIMVGISAKFLHGVRMKSKDETKRRAAQVITSLLSMTQGWCWLSWGAWHFWNTTGDKGVGEGDVMSARLAMVTNNLIGCFFFIFLFIYLTRKGVMSAETQLALTDSIGLILGLSWESCVNVAMEGIHFKFKGPQEWRVFDGLADLFIALLVGLAWAYHILPKALEYIKEFEQELSASEDGQTRRSDEDDEKRTPQH